MKTWIVLSDGGIVAWLKADDEQEAQIIAVSAGYNRYGEPAELQCLDDLPELT